MWSQIRGAGVVLGILFLVFSTDQAFGQSAYEVTIDTSFIRGFTGSLSFDLTSNRPRTNRVDIFNFVSDAKFALPETFGGLVAGDLIENINAATFTRMAGNHFFNNLTLPVESFGQHISFIINASETGPRGGGVPDEFAFSLVYHTSSPFARRHDYSGPTFGVTITGQRGGQLELLGRRIKTSPHQVVKVDAREGFPFSITPIWVDPKDERKQPEITVEGSLSEFCTRRCEGEPTCFATEFGISVDDGRFFRFDDVGNLKARVALVEGEKDEEVESRRLLVRVRGSLLNDTTIRVADINLF